MPLKRCQKDGKQGWKWGDSGNCYTGTTGRSRALAQARAILASQARAQKSDNPETQQLLLDLADVIEAEEEQDTKDKTEKPTTFIKKMDEELQIVWGEVYVPGAVDSQGDFMTAEEVRKLAYRFMARTDKEQVDVLHNNKRAGCMVVESFIAREDDPVFIPDSWVVGVHVPDTDLWESIKKGDLNGFSMQARVYREATELEIEVPEVVKGVTMKGGEPEHEHEYKIVFDENGKITEGVTSMVDGHVHRIGKASVTEPGGTGNHVHRFSFVEQFIRA